MRLFLKIYILILPVFLFGQNVVSDAQTFSAQQLIEDILIDSNCVENVVVTNAVSGNFGNSDKSYGFFNATGTTFPFQSGIVLSTGKLSNVNGPNTSLSDDDGTNWTGDNDLEEAVQETGTLNATILEFDFTSIADQISFRYIFASEEYQENNSSTCNYSDLFGFLIRPQSGTDYENIALVPGTTTPVKVTTVHPEIPGSCDAQNEFYFESFNDNAAPINFNGQTKVLTATANTIPNQVYHVKLVIADEQNYRYDSAVFLEAGSFKLNTNLGPDRLLANQMALCGTETLTLNAFQTNALSYKWFKNGVEILGEISNEYEVTSNGFYEVEVTLNNTCLSEGNITIEYAQNPTINNTTIFECDLNQDGLTTFNLFNSGENILTAIEDDIENFYLNFSDAENEINEIQTPLNYNNTSVNQTVFAVVKNFQSRCSSIAEITLSISNNAVNINDLNVCEDDTVDGIATFNLNDIIPQIQSQIPANFFIVYYPTENDVIQNTNTINPIAFSNTIPFSQTIYVKISDNDTNDCFSVATLTLNVIERPEVGLDYSTSYCLNNFPDTIALNGEVTNAQTNSTFQWFLDSDLLPETSASISINEIGTYEFVVTNPNQCETTQTITVNAVELPIISTIDYTELTENNSVTIVTENNGDFEYTLDNPDLLFQDSNNFNNVSVGIHTAYVREKNGCGITEQVFYILGFPKFFTPNNDGFNDYWKPKGISELTNTILDIKIFDRYGKLLKQIGANSQGWNGNFNNNPMPTDDYWFIITTKNNETYAGHFTLKR